ncbi:hypothetical protein ACTJKO_07750 [Curtobacterium sp. 22159]|uniref:hypothetical protein n=1 Tax=Curtobacterium sp. 22159 TaxID=3453882 RepID=UPI003F85DE4D
MSSKTVKATAFLQIEPEWSPLAYGSDRDNPASVRCAKAVAITQKRSKSPRPGTVEVKITIEIPAGAFVPLRPEATVVIPEELITAHPIVVEAADAGEEAR